MTIRDQGEKVGLYIYKISTDYGSSIKGPHRNEFLPDEGKNKNSNPDIDTASKPDLDITQCTEYIFNDQLNPNLNTPSSNFAPKDNGTTKIQLKDTPTKDM